MNKTGPDALGFFGCEALFGNKIGLDQFHLPSEQEDWQDPDKNK